MAAASAQSVIPAETEDDVVPAAADDDIRSPRAEEPVIPSRSQDRGGTPETFGRSQGSRWGSPRLWQCQERCQ
jgi:hypothetical protein